MISDLDITQHHLKFWFGNRIGIFNRHIVLAYRIGISYWHIVLAYRIGISYWHITLAYRIGISYWDIVLAYRIGISNCVLDVKLPFIQEIVLSNCMFECQFVCFDVKMSFNIYILILALITLHKTWQLRFQQT